MDSAKKDISEHYKHLLTIADSVSFHLNYLDENETFLFVNEASSKYWGLPREQMIGKTIRELCGEEAYPHLKKYLDRVLSGETVSHESKFQARDGSTSYFLNQYIPDFDSNGKVVGFVASGNDVTLRKKAFDEARKLADEFKTLADSMPQIVWTANPDGHVDYYNKRWYEFTGLPEGSADNKLWDQIIYPDDKQILFSTWENALKTGVPYEVEFRIKNAKTGEYRWLLSRARPVRDENGDIIKWYGSNTDIDDQKKTLQKLQVETELREKVISALSHDIRTPLTAAKISGRLILKKSSDPAIQKHAIKVEENMDRADSMIQDLLDVSKIKAGHKLSLQLKNCDLMEIARMIIEDFSIMHGDRFILTGPHSLEAEFDYDGVRRVIENLISNAVKYGEQNSKIILKIEERNNSAIIHVINFGNPIPPEAIHDLFAPYKRAVSTAGVKGWGIGLSLVKGLTEAHGGHVDVTSSHQEGTRFTVWLPISVQNHYLHN